MPLDALAGKRWIEAVERLHELVDDRDAPALAGEARGNRRANATASDYHGVHERLPLSGERASGA
jgi:hypothetical protein